MFSSRGFRVLPLFTVTLGIIALFFLTFTHAQNFQDPWTTRQTVQPTDLAKELAGSKSAPTILFVGFQRLFASGHIKGAQYHGSGGNAEGLAEIKKWATPLPRSTNLVIYCGCCPMERCPNVRPAFTALHDMGFTKLRILILPTDFEVDWAQKGLPYEKGQ
jgi:thiosulfate/3-mercaptopyruvate sulfurtransferase